MRKSNTLPLTERKSLAIGEVSKNFLQTIRNRQTFGYALAAGSVREAAAPAGARVTMGLDPGFRSGVKVAVVDATGKVLTKEIPLPNIVESDRVSAAVLNAEGHETKPPARYTEASLIKELEEREIGRPSTYASIIGTILNRGYVYKKGTALVPAWLAFSVVGDDGGWVWMRPLPCGLPTGCGRLGRRRSTSGSAASAFLVG